ncbi:EamA-like transporter family protein [Loktanella atrilutea]|uniref:EamA-like transporter family protein n=1 Tax=Loktanella atrilutea TaxID=366533 RepID=A0A1M4WST4_LOKAT|nr:DMT family transporter [Loktanella atrilutea]SHE84268.1 EamA-like transporter family protein [Loktanella atrilutea]
MTLTVFFAVLAAAVLHAVWNALIRSGTDKQTAMLVLTLGNALTGLCVVATRPWPGGEVWVWIIASGAIHTAYQLFLAYAYEQGDLSRVYPLARGGAPMIVLAVSLIFALDAVSGTEVAGVLLLGAGLAVMARGVFDSGESRRMLPFAAGSACATAAYTLTDGIGARVGGDPVGYTGWLLIAAAVFYVPVILALRGRTVVPRAGRVWGIGLVAGACSFMAYGIVVWAMTQAPIALVAALRETSILFAVIIGWRVFGEAMGRQKAAAALLIVAGVVLTRI